VASTDENGNFEIKDHGGRIIRFEDITMDMLRPIKPDHSSQPMSK
jgi:nitrous oxide reductase accessory protein NosL